MGEITMGQVLQKLDQVAQLDDRLRRADIEAIGKFFKENSIIEFCISNRAFIPTVQRGGLMQGRTSAVYRQSDEHVGYLHAD